MLPLTEIPTIVSHYSSHFAGIFTPSDFSSFQRYISGLMISENKTIEAINRLFVFDSKSMMTLNRFLTQSKYEEWQVNQCRLDMLQSQSATNFKPTGVLSIDNSQLSHYGEHFDLISFQKNHTKGSYEWLHDLVSLHYSDATVDYPVFCRLWEPVDVVKLETALRKEDIFINAQKAAQKETKPKQWKKYLLYRYGDYQHKKPALQKTYKTKIHWAKLLLIQFNMLYPKVKLPVCFDHFYTEPYLCNFIDQELDQIYIGSLEGRSKVVGAGGKLEELKDFTAQLVKQQKQEEQLLFKPYTIPYKGGKETYYAYSKIKRIKGFGRKKLVISFSKKDLSDRKPRYFICNQHQWQAQTILAKRRHRWPIEVFYEEGKAEGLDKYQLRNQTGIRKHIAAVAVVYSMLQMARQDAVLQQKLQCQFEQQGEGSIAFWRRLTQADSFYRLVFYIMTMVKKGLDFEQIMKPFEEIIAYQ